MRFFRLLLCSGPPDEVSVAAAGHAEQLAVLRAAGKLHMAGRFANGEGYGEVLEVADRHEAERLTRESPLVERGLVSWMLREWTEEDED